MARKKSRHVQPPPPSRPTVATTAITTAPKPVAAPAPIQRPQATAQETSAVELLLIRASKMLGSLQVAVILLSIFAAVVLLGTLMEHWYSTKIAQELVYRSWWFVGLLFFLSINIFFAAVKKGEWSKIPHERWWPWKKHQTGFIITHIGLLLMLFGGMLNAWSGVDAQMAMIDTSDPEVVSQARQAFGPIDQIGRTCIYSDTSMITIAETEPEQDQRQGPHRGKMGAVKTGGQTKVVKEDFEGGPLPWNPDEKTTARTDWLLGIMTWLRSPFGRSWSTQFDDRVALEVIDYLPFAHNDPFSPAEGKTTTFPAIKIEFRSGMFPRSFDGWMAFEAKYPGSRTFSPGFPMPGQIEFIGYCPRPLVDSFKNPPAKKEKGILTIVSGNSRVAIPVEEALKSKEAVRIDKELQVRVLDYKENWNNPKAEEPTDPAVEFEVIENGRSSGKATAFARKTGVLMMSGREVAVSAGDPLLAWYDPPDFQFGNDKLRGLLQLVMTEDGRLLYRSMTAQENGGFALESVGQVARGEDYVPFWKRMNGKFRIPDVLPNAVVKERYYAANVTPGKETQEEKMMFSAAILCRLTDGKTKQEIWVPHGDSRQVNLGGRNFEIGFGVKQKKLGFEIKLERAEQMVDPGTRAPASYTSYVQLFDPEQGINGKPEIITMNEPLKHRGYSFYQSQYEDLHIEDSSGKTVNLSGFTVGHDPGLPIKYAGSLCLALGIFMMFYMRAYFFKPARRAAAAPAATS